MEVALNTYGVLRRLPVRGIPLFGGQMLLAPALSSTYIAYALERGMFARHVLRHAASLDGLSVLVGRHHNLHFPDTVYVVAQMSPESKTYKIVLAWRDRGG